MRTTKSLLIAASLLVLSLSFVTAAKSGARKQRPLTRAELKQVEARLAEMGYGPGRVDGVIDDNTRRALLLFR
jgi:hypothetical protein